MATSIPVGPRNSLKRGFFLLLALCTLLVIVVDERFLIDARDPEWAHIAPFRGLLLIHGLSGIIAFLIGPLQFSERLRARRAVVHRWLGRVYVGAIAIAAPIATYIGYMFEGRITAPEQIAQGGLWFACTGIALGCALRRNFILHKVWMMRSYGFCVVFVASRVPDAIPGFRWSDLLLAHTLWWLIAAALIAPDLVHVARAILRPRRTARAAALQP